MPSIPRQVRCRHAVRLALTLGAALLAACSGERGATPPTQVAARVNGQDISIHQVLSVLQRHPGLAAEQQGAAARKALDNLVEQELAAQAARDAGLDKQPRVVQALEVAKREVLARAFQDELAAKASGPSSDEIDRYFEANPLLFMQRRLYVLQETAVEADASAQPRLRQLVGAAKGADDLQAALSAAGLRARSRQLVRAAEDLPLGWLEPLSRLQVGQSMLMPEASGGRVYTVLHAQVAPVDRRLANDAIAGYLTAERKRANIAEAMKALRDKAKIEVQDNPALTGRPAASAASGAAR